MRFNFVPLCVGWVSIRFEVFHDVFPSCRGLIWFPCGLGGAIFLKLKGNIISDPPPDIFSLCGECLKNVYGEIRVSVTFMSVEGHLDVVPIFYILVAQVCILLARLSRFAKNIFNLQLFASILGALRASILGALCASILAPLSASILVPLCIVVPRGVRKLQGVYFGFLVA